MADHIQIGDISPRVQFTGDGAQTLFTYPFPIFKDADLKVYEDTTLKTLTTDYTVLGAGNSAGGSATFLVAPANGVIVTLKRQLAIQRTSDFQESGEFRSKVINDELDTLTASLQQVDDDVSRSLRLGATDTAASLELPVKGARTSKFLAFDANGNPIASDGPAGSVAVSTFGATLIDDADDATARTTLGLAIGTDVLSPNGDGSGLTGIATGATDAQKANIILNAFRIAINGGLSVQNMVDGVSDEFEDETGVDVGTSTNEYYDATSDYYSNTAITLIDASAETKIGDMTGAAGLAAAYDGVVNSYGGGAVSQTTADTAGPAYNGIDWGDGVTKTLTRCIVYSPSDNTMQPGGANNITVVLQGSTDNFSGSIVDLGTLVIGTSVANTAYEITGLTTTTAYRYHRIKISSSGAAGVLVLAEIGFYEDVTGNMTLVSNASTALATPTDAFIVLWQQDVDAVTLNTDLAAEASCDGGTTWDAITLTEEATLSTGRILTGGVTLTSTGTSMKYRINTLNTKDQRLHGVGLQWS